jgi:AcrR family transcriptional regulator
MSRRAAKTNRQAIARAVLRVVDDAGVEGVTIRGVARAAGVAPMTLYTYIENKDQLLDIAREGLVEQLDPQLEGVRSWESALRLLCHHLRQLLLDHPYWIPLVELPSPASLPARERVVTLLRAAGRTEEEATAVVTRATFMALGLTMVELAQRDGVRAAAKVAEDVAPAAADARLTMTEHAVRNMAEGAAELQLGELFSNVVEAFIAGLDVQNSVTRS